MANLSVYEILRKPLITEKSSFQNDVLRQYAFIVDVRATKIQIKDAVEELFDVTVARVNTARMPAKRKRDMRSRRNVVRKAEFKKALVTLVDGDIIEIFEGVK